jgi:hypothetical protein
MRLDGIPHSIAGSPGIGHAHFWERALSRRSLMQAAGAAGLALAGGRMLRPAAGWAASTGGGAEPRPIPGGFVTVDDRRWHAYPPGPSDPLDPSSVMNEPSAITDFDGVMTIAQVQGTGTEESGGQSMPLPYDADMRVMAGRYVGFDGQEHRGTFVLI